MKKQFVSLLCVVLALACVLGACSKTSSDGETTTAQVEESTSATTDADGEEASTKAETVMFYDRLGKSYDSLYELPYYDENGKIYYYDKSTGEARFVDKKGNAYDVNRCFINAKGYFVYDEASEIALDESALGATDKKGRKYYPAVTIRWTDNGYMKTVFGVGHEVKMLDDDVDID